jgi:hypothetical protein
LTVEGAPRGARVWLNGKAIGDASGSVAVPRGDAPLKLTVTAPGHEPHTVTVVPKRAASVRVSLKKRGAGAPPQPAISRDLESPF